MIDRNVAPDLNIKHITALEIYKATPRTNCGECGAPNCMTFGALVIQKQKDAGSCPYLDEETIRRAREDLNENARVDARSPESRLLQMLDGIKEIDLEKAARRLGGWVNEDRLALRCLGKIFELDRYGGLHSLCHINPWVHVSILQYVLFGKGLDPVGKWTAFRDLKGAKDYALFFAHRCEGTFKMMAARDTELFLDILELFGRRVDIEGIEAEYKILLHPLPKVPFLFAYTPAEGSFESSFNLLFDRTIEDNLKAGGTYMLGQGIAEMVRLTMARHGV